MTVLDAAAKLTEGDRRTTYGHPFDNHSCTAALWSAYLVRLGWLPPGEDRDPLEARDVCMMNILQKVSRDANIPHQDNLIDISGYARNAEMIDEEEERRRLGSKLEKQEAE